MTAPADRHGRAPTPARLLLSSPQVGVIPKTDFLGHLKFFISAYNATKLDLPTVAECGNATLTTVGFSGQGAQVDSVLFNAQRIAKKLVDTKNITTVKSQVRGEEGLGGSAPPAVAPPTVAPTAGRRADRGDRQWPTHTHTRTRTRTRTQELYGPHLAATRVGKCLTDRYAPPRFAANKTTDSAATVAAAALASLKPTLKINSSIDAKSLDPTFTPRTCKSQMLCSPEGSVTVADSGCQPSAVGNTFVLVNDGTPVDSVACAPAGVVGNVGYQELTPGESSDCVLTNTCELPLQAPEDNLVGGVCVVGGLESPCYSQGEGCPPGQIQITDEAGTCTTGFCCASPTCPVPNQLCGGTTCVDTQTDEANCGFCGTPCPNNPDVVCDGGQCQCTDGTPIASGADVQLLAQGTTRVGEESVDTFALSTPTCSVGASPCSCTLVYDSQSIPDRYIVRSGDVCSTLVFDTGFTGLVSSGCAASAPCCEASLGGGCTGTKGDFCPPNMPSTPG